MQRYLKALFSLETLIKPANGAFAAIGAALSPVIEAMFASGKLWVYLFLFSIVIADWITGTAAAKKNDTYRSEYGHAGVLRNVFLLFIPFIAMLLDKVMMTVFGIVQPGVVFYAITFKLSYHNWESMTANCARAGWSKWIPDSVLHYVSSEIKAKSERAIGMQGERANDRA